LAIIISQKVTRVTSHHLHYSTYSKCPPAAQTQAVEVDIICQLHDSSGPLDVDVSFQCVDLQF